MIKLFPSSYTNFTTNGLGRLIDAISCFVTEERNGQFELEMEYPITGSHYSDISLRCIIYAKPNPYSNPQPFRIYSISKPIKGIVTINARHISYDLSGYPVSPFNATSVQTAFINMKAASVIACPFTLTTYKTNVGDLAITKPISIRSILGNEILNNYGGEYEFDNFTVLLHEQRGQNRGVKIQYGKNLIDLKQEENCSAVYTGVYPFWYSENDGLIELTEKILNAPGTYDFVRIYPLDLSGMWTEVPTQDQLRAEANNFMTNNNIGIPKVSIELSFIQLAEYDEYKDLVNIEVVKLCDYVNIKFPDLGVSAVAECIKTVYDVLIDKYDSVSLGDAQSNIASTISDGFHNIDKTITKSRSFMEDAIKNATDLITGAKGGYVLIHRDPNGKPYEILIMDTDDINTAVNVWRWDINGLGFSKNGYNGPFPIAMTMDGKIVADFITSGTLDADLLNVLNLVVGENVTMGALAKISWNNVTNQPSIPSTAAEVGALPDTTYIPDDAHMTQITNNTLSTTNVLAQNLQVYSANISGVLSADKIIYGGSPVVKLQTNHPDYAGYSTPQIFQETVGITITAGGSGVLIAEIWMSAGLPFIWQEGYYLPSIEITAANYDVIVGLYQVYQVGYGWANPNQAGLSGSVNAFKIFMVPKGSTFTVSGSIKAFLTVAGLSY